MGNSAIRDLEQAAEEASEGTRVLFERAAAFIAGHPDRTDVGVWKAEPGARLAARGDPDDTVLFLVRGEVVATMVSSNGTSTDRPVAAPALVGELAALTGSRTSGLRAGADGAKLVTVGGSTFRLMRDDPVFAREYERQANRRLLVDEQRNIPHP